MSARSRYFEEFEEGAFYSTTSRLITLEDHLAFCRLVGYEVPLFLDEKVAAETDYGSIICPSHLIMSFSTAMTGALFTQSVIALMALENARFLHPVHPGDTLRTEVEVLNKRPTRHAERGVITFRDHVYNQHDQEVFRNDKIVLLKRQPVDATGSPA